MRATVVQAYRDKNTNLFYAKGTEIEITKKRFGEVNSTSLGVFVEVVKKAVG